MTQRDSCCLWVTNVRTQNMKRDETEAKRMTYNVIAKKMAKEENIKEVNLPKCNAFIFTQGSHNKKSLASHSFTRKVFLRKEQMMGVGDDAHYMPKKLHPKEKGRERLCQWKKLKLRKMLRGYLRRKCCWQEDVDERKWICEEGNGL